MLIFGCDIEPSIVKNSMSKTSSQCLRKMCKIASRSLEPFSRYSGHAFLKHADSEKLEFTILCHFILFSNKI